MPPSSANRPAVLAALLLTVLAAAPAQPIAPDAVASAPESEVEARLTDSHPAAYFAYAERLWYEARRDEAVLWLYIGQIRYRLFLAVNPQPDAAGESARFKRLQDTIGEPIERYAGSDIPRWRRQLASALAWDRAHPNGFTSKKRFASEWEDARNVLANLIIYLNRHAPEFSKQREQDGIGDIGLATLAGPYLDIRKPRMPSDWPMLLPHTSLPMLNGYYALDDPVIAQLLFPDDTAALATVNNLQLIAEDDDRHLAITARHENTFLGETRITLQEEPDALVYTRELFGAAAGLSTGTRIVHLRLRRNEIGDLVLQLDSLTEGTYPGKKFQVHLDVTKWYRAERVTAGDEPGR